MVLVLVLVVVVVFVARSWAPTSVTGWTSGRLGHAAALEKQCNPCMRQGGYARTRTRARACMHRWLARVRNQAVCATLCKATPSERRCMIDLVMRSRLGSWRGALSSSAMRL